VDKTQNPSDSKCYTQLSKPFRTSQIDVYQGFGRMSYLCPHSKKVSQTWKSGSKDTRRRRVRVWNTVKESLEKLSLKSEES
jgi:hypothetical protein